MKRWVWVLCLVACLDGCADDGGKACSPGLGSSMVVFNLFFGKAVPGRGDLTDPEWQDFLDNTVTVNLPNGYTILDAAGAWMNPMTRKTIKEGTKMLIVALPEDAGSLAAVNRIRNAYQLRFNQQMVGMTVERACGTF